MCSWYFWIHIKEDKITCSYSPLLLFLEKRLHKIHTAHAGFITKSMGFPLGEGKARPSIAEKSWRANTHPLQQGKRAVKSMKAVLSPTKVENFFSGADTTCGCVQTRACVVWDAHHWACSLQGHRFKKERWQMRAGQASLGVMKTYVRD